MEVIEDGNVMDRIPILLQRDFEYYQKNQTVLSETICCGVVGGSLDFPRNASFSAAKIVLWLEDEFTIAFKQGSGMFVQIEDEKKPDSGVAKTSSPDKFVQLAVKSADMLLEHLHVLVQEALDHADLPVLTATLGAAAVLKNSLYCYVQHLEDMGSSERLSTLQACYKRYVTMFEAVGERLLDLHNRVLSLYIMQDAGGRPIDEATCVHENGTPSVQGWWLYMNGIRKDLWNTVPPRMAQRIFAGMLNETLTILTVRYCQSTLSERTLPLYLNDCLNILLCAAQLLPSICARGSDLAGLDANNQSRDVRDVHAKCNELFKCMVLRGAEVHFIHQAFKDNEATSIAKDNPYPWFTFVSPHLFAIFDDAQVKSTGDLPRSTAVGLELIVLLAQPQPSWPLLIKVLMMRNCHLARLLLTHALCHMSIDNARWPANGLWYSMDGRQKCNGFLCTADGFCQFKPDSDAGGELARAAGALTYILTAIGSKSELKSTLCDALEVSGRDWAACVDQRQIWCDRRPPWLAGLLGLVNTALQYIPEVLVNAVHKGASMYQTMSLCLSCIERSLDCIPDTLCNAAAVIEGTLPSTVNPIGGSVLLQLLLTKTYEEITNWAKTEEVKEKAAASNVEVNGIIKKSTPKAAKHVRIVSLNTNTSSSVSFDGSHSSSSSIAFAIAEALCSIGEDDKHTQQIERLVSKSKEPFLLSDNFGLEDLPQFAAIFKEGEDIPSSNAERESDAESLTSEILMTSPGRDSVRVIYSHLQLHRERIFRELGISEGSESGVNLSKAPLLYVMFHIGRWPFDQYFRDEWPMPWSRLVAVAKRWSSFEGARVHINRRVDIRNIKSHTKNRQLQELYEIFKSSTDHVLL